MGAAKRRGKIPRRSGHRRGLLDFFGQPHAACPGVRRPDCRPPGGPRLPSWSPCRTGQGRRHPPEARPPPPGPGWWRGSSLPAGPQRSPPGAGRRCAVRTRRSQIPHKYRILWDLPPHRARSWRRFPRSAPRSTRCPDTRQGTFHSTGGTARCTPRWQRSKPAWAGPPLPRRSQGCRWAR